MKRFIIMTSLLLAGLLSSGARADFEYEGFDYPGDRDGEQLTSEGNGGAGWASAWTGNGAFGTDHSFWTRVGSLQFGQLETSGNSVQSTGGYQVANGVARTTSQPLVADGIETRFLSFLIRANYATSTDYGGVYIDGTTDDIFVGKGGTFTNWGMETLGGTDIVESNVPATVNQTALLVLKMESASRGFDRFTLYVNPTPGQSEPNSGVVKFLDVGTVKTIGLFTNANFSFDEIRIGDSFAAVTPMISSTPEPSAIVLGALGLAPLLVPRMRRRFTRSRRGSCGECLEG